MTDAHFKPFSIGSLRLKNALISAPLAGLSSLPYRILAMEYGCALAISEMVASEGIIRAHEKTRHYYKNDELARPFGVQVFGANPRAMAEAAKILIDGPIDLIDINMGCPVRKVCSKGAGSALMKTPELACEIVRAVRVATKLPLTVKFRSGWDEASVNCAEFAKMMEDCGAEAVVVHPRTKTQEFKGRADWSQIAKVKSAVKIPVIGNGDVKCRADALRMMEETSCDGVMIGRAAVGRPWIFQEVITGEEYSPSPEERARTIIRHIEMLEGHLGEKKAVLNMRTVLPWYLKGLRGGKELMREVYKIKGFEELKEIVEKFFLSLRGA